MKCNKCSNGFFLEDQQCVKSEEIENCWEYHPSAKKSCLKCGPNSSKVSIKSCKAILNPIKNCQTYSQSQTCLKCQDGYVLPNCDPILFSENCLEKKPNANLCLKCNSRSFMYADNCYYKQDLGLETCSDSGFDLSSLPFTCSFCENTSELLTIESFNATCGIENFQDFFSGKCISMKMNPDGKHLRLTKGNPECIRCRSGYFLSETSSDLNFGKNDCVTECALSSNSSVSSQLVVDANTSQVVKIKDNLCLSSDEILNNVADCFLFGSHLQFEAGVATFPNLCFQCHSYAYQVISLFDTLPKGFRY